MILVTGATGHLGTAVIDQLLKLNPKEPFAALARSEEKAGPLREKGVRVRIGDFDDLSSLEKAFAGVDRLLLISTIAENRAEQQKAVVDAAKKAGVKHIAYTGVSMRDVDTSALKMLMESHFQTEDHIRESGLTYTFLRNTLYTDMIPVYVGEQVFEKGIYFPAGSGKTPFALRREMGEAAANVLAGEGHENKTYDITASGAYSYDDIARALSAVSGKEVTYTDADAGEFRDRMRAAGAPEFVVSMIAGFAEDQKAGQLEAVSADLEMLLGRKPAGLEDGLREIYKM